MLAIFGVLVFLGTACDSSVDAIDEDAESVTVSGRVSENEDSQSADKTAQSSTESLAAVEGAVVTAVAVHADGSVSALDGEATTDANGEFTFVAEGEGVTDHIRVIADGDGDFVASSIVQVNGQSSVNTPPLTTDSHAKAEVYLEAKSEDGVESHYEGVTAADVYVFINSDVAVEINSGTQSAADLGAAIASGVKAQAEYNDKAEAGVNMNAIVEARSDAFTRLQSDLAAASNNEARAEAFISLEESYIDVFTENGVDIEKQGEFHQIFASILIEASGEANGNAELGLRKQAELILTQATALTIEGMFQAEGASEATIESLEDARATLVAEIRAASSEEVIVDAKADYKATVDAETESNFGISSEVRAAAEAEIDSSVNALESTLAGLSIFIGNIAEATAEAFNDFYLDAQVEAETSFEASGMEESEAEAAAKVIIMTSVLISA